MEFLILVAMTLGIVRAADTLGARGDALPDAPLVTPRVLVPRADNIKTLAWFSADNTCMPFSTVACMSPAQLTIGNRFTLGIRSKNIHLHHLGAVLSTMSNNKKV